MGFLDDEAGVELSEPRQVLKIEMAGTIGQVHRIALGTRDIVVDGAKYTASPAARSDLKTPVLGVDAFLEVTLPLAHAVPQRWMAGGVPPKRVVMTLYRQQLNSGEFQIDWKGVVEAMAIEKHVAVFRIPSEMTRTAQRRLATITAGRTCVHVFGDSNCRIDRDDFRDDANVGTFSGRDVTLTGFSQVSGWATFGELRHEASGEGMSIFEQAGSVVTMQLPIYGLAAGDAVQVFAGCDHTLATCQSKFSNVENFGGFFAMPKINPFLPGGSGVRES